MVRVRLAPINIKARRPAAKNEDLVHNLDDVGVVADRRESEQNRDKYDHALQQLSVALARLTEQESVGYSSNEAVIAPEDNKIEIVVLIRAGGPQSTNDARSIEFLCTLHSELHPRGKIHQNQNVLAGHRILYQ